MPGRQIPEIIEVRAWLRQAQGYEMRMREAIARERRLGKVEEPGAERVRARQRAATDAWARAWIERAAAIDSVPDARWAAVLGYRYLQGRSIMQTATAMDAEYKTIQQWDKMGALWLAEQGYPETVKKEAPR